MLTPAAASARRPALLALLFVAVAGHPALASHCDTALSTDVAARQRRWPAKSSTVARGSGIVVEIGVGLIERVLEAVEESHVTLSGMIDEHGVTRARFPLQEDALPFLIFFKFLR